MKIPGIKLVFDAVLELIFPPLIECPICGLEHDGELCPICREEIKKLGGLSCSVCGRIFGTQDAEIFAKEPRVCRGCMERPPLFDFAKAVGVYDGLIKDAVYLLKYTGKQSLVPLLGSLLIEQIVEDERFLAIDLIIPIPLHQDKLIERTFNQAELLAKEVSGELNIPVDVDSLVRIKNTYSQSKLTAEERRRNLRNSFVVVSGRDLKDKKVLLIDDIVTTGSTVEECTRVLKNSGVSQVYVVTLATGLIG